MERLLKPAGAAAAGVMAAALPALAHADGSFSGYGHGMMDGGAWGAGAGFAGFAMMLIFWGALIALIVVAVRWLWHAQPGQTPGADGSPARADPRDILKERLARGEIDVKDYEERLKSLGG